MRVRDLLTVGVLATVLGAMLSRQRAHSDLDPRAMETTPRAASPGGRPRVLFIGNSFTSVNDLPRLFARLAQSLGTPVIADGYAPGGRTLEGHTKDPEVLRRVKSAEWDFVVLQEQSQKPAFAPGRVEAETIAPALQLNGLIRAAQPGAQVVFYETWGRKNGDQDNCRALPDICTYSGMQQRLNASYRLMAARASGILAPVGEAWARVRTEHPEIELYGPDGVHPSLAGSYLAACVFYAALIHRTLKGADTMGLGEREARILQSTAEEVVPGGEAKRRDSRSGQGTFFLQRSAGASLAPAAPPR